MQGNFTCHAEMNMPTQPTVLKPTKCHEYKRLRKMSFTRMYLAEKIFSQSDTAFGQQMSYSNLRIYLFWNSALAEVLQNEEKSK